MTFDLRRLASALACTAGLLVSAGCQHAAPRSKALRRVTAATSPTRVASASVAPAVALAARPPPCLPRFASDGSVVHLEAHGDRALVCFDSGAAAAYCIEVDPSTGAITAHSEWQGKPDEVVDSGAFCAKASQLGVDVCPRSGATPCQHVVTSSEPLGAAVNDDGSRAFVFVAEVNPQAPMPWKLFGEVYDARTGRRLTRRQLSSTSGYTDQENVYVADFVGSSLLLRDELPDRTDGIMALWDARLSRATFLAVGPFVKLDGSTWAGANHDGVTFFDVAKSAALGKPIENPPPWGASGRAGLLAMGERVLWAWSSPPGILTFDRKTHVASVARALLVCP